jgi:hypothetical protein
MLITLRSNQSVKVLASLVPRVVPKWSINAQHAQTK